MTAQTITAPLTTAAPMTRTLLRGGVLAGPLYLAVGFVQALTRDGFDLTRHPFSFLSLGDQGWLQIANFVVCGLLFVAAAVGIRRVARGTWGPLLIGGMGVGMIGGGVFLADPAYGFPAGAPAGAPELLSWHGVLHGVAFGVAILCWIAACFVFTRRFAVAGQRGWAGYSAVTGAVLLALGLAGTGGAVVLLYIAAVAGWVWTTAVCARLLKV